MRPLGRSETFQPCCQKSSSLPEPALPVLEARSSSPVAFFLRRGSPGLENSTSSETERGRSGSPIQTPADDLDHLPQSTSTLVTDNDAHTITQSPQPHSIAKTKTLNTSQRSPIGRVHGPLSQHEPLTPLLTPSAASSLPSSPKSTSTRSFRPSEIGSLTGDATSQGVSSSGDEEPTQEPRPPPESAVKPFESAPQLIMPSIKMPSRRPFTDRGKLIGNFKILIAGRQGVGKTSLIKSIVQTCEDIVHVDSLPSSKPAAKGKQGSEPLEPCSLAETSASTRPYPTWWSELEDSNMLRRRRSLGDTVLDRNLCFVDVSGYTDCDKISSYMTGQLQKTMSSQSTSNHELAALLAGSGGSQVDVVLYMLSQETLDADVLQMQALSELGNVVPLISKADLLSPDRTEALKVEVRSKFKIDALPKLPWFNASDQEDQRQDTSSPYTVSSITGPDHETMDASLLMSPDYIQPLVPSELALLVQHIFQTDIISYLRYSAARKLITWQGNYTCLTDPANPTTSPLAFSPPVSSLALQHSNPASKSGMPLPPGSDLSESMTSNSQAMTRLAEHTRQEERLAQVRLEKWASDLQSSLQRERERFEKLVKGDRAIWLVERLGEEAKDGGLGIITNSSGALIKAGSGDDEDATDWLRTRNPMHDPLGLLKWKESAKIRGWVALQVVGSVGVIGGLAYWLTRVYDN